MHASQHPKSRLPRRLSPAAIDRYRGCPHTAHLQFIVGARADHVVTPARLVGNAVHEALDAFFGMDPRGRSEACLHELLRTAWRGQPREPAFASSDEESFYGRQAMDQLSGFIERFDCSGRPFARERWVEAPLPNGSIVYGKVDRLDLLTGVAGMSGACLDITDYKSGRATIEDEDLPTDAAAQVYVLATEWQTKAPIRRVRYLYLATGQEARWEVEREDVEAARQRLNDLTWRMHTDQLFEARPGQRCVMCPFRAACTAYNDLRGGVGARSDTPCGRRSSPDSDSSTA